jgi:hypothetical protein
MEIYFFYQENEIILVYLILHYEILSNKYKKLMKYVSLFGFEYVI